MIVAAVEVVLNATIRKEAEEKITRLKNLYNALSRTNKAILHSRHRDILFREICRIAVEYGKLTLAAIGTIAPGNRSVTPVTYCGKGVKYLDSLTVSADSGSEEGRGPTGIAIRDGVPYVCNDFHRVRRPNRGVPLPWKTTSMPRRHFRSGMKGEQSPYSRSIPAKKDSSTGKLSIPPGNGG